MREKEIEKNLRLLLNSKNKTVQEQVYLISESFFKNTLGFLVPGENDPKIKRLFEMIKSGKSLKTLTGEIEGQYKNKKTRKVIKSWNKKRAKKVFETLKNWLVGRKILDYGAGLGLLGKEITLKLKKEVVLTDIADKNITSLPFWLSGPEKTPFPDGQFDTVLLVNVLHHTKNPQKIISEAKRISKNRIIILEHHIYHKKKARGLSEKEWNRIAAFSELIFHSFKPEGLVFNFLNYFKLLEIFKKLNLKIIHQENIKHPEKPLAHHRWLFVL